MSRQRVFRQDVVNYLRDNPGSTIPQIMLRTGGTRLSIEQHLIRLVIAGQVVNRGYAGGSKTGVSGDAPGVWYLAPTTPEARPMVNSVFALGASL